MKRLMAQSGSSTFVIRPSLYKSFLKFYYAHVSTEEYGISWKLSEMMRHMVAHLCATQGRGA